MKFEGVYVALATPFRKDGEVCYDGLQRLLRRIADQKAQGFVPCATTGEGPTLLPSERQKIIEMTVQFGKAHGLQTIAGCSSNDTREAVALTQAARDLGCDAALVVTPYYNRPTKAGVVAHYEKIAESGGLPVLLYNVPGRTALSLSPETVFELLAHPNIVGIKEASGQYSQWLALASGMDWTEKSLLSGDDDCLAPVMALGGCGIISASANVATSYFVAIYEAARRGDWPTAFALQKKIFPLVRAMFAETNPAPVKFALSELGVTEETLRLPLVPVANATRDLVRDALRTLEVR
jgi:4-hydroxy-tetrahydrodipicolinate synthase